METENIGFTRSSHTVQFDCFSDLSSNQIPGGRGTVFMASVECFPHSYLVIMASHIYDLLPSMTNAL